MSLIQHKKKVWALLHNDMYEYQTVITSYCDLSSGSLTHALGHSCNIRCTFPHVACPSSSLPHVHLWSFFKKLTIGSYICIRLHHVLVKYFRIRYYFPCESSAAIQNGITNTTSNTHTCFTTLIWNWAQCQLNGVIAN